MSVLSWLFKLEFLRPDSAPQGIIARQIRKNNERWWKVKKRVAHGHHCIICKRSIYALRAWKTGGSPGHDTVCTSCAPTELEAQVEWSKSCYPGRPECWAEYPEET